MEAAWQDATISQCAKTCLQSFNDCLAQFHLLSPRQQSAVDDQLGRFSIWVSNIGVFAPTRGSLDYRLREAPDIQRLVRRLLRTLNEYIQQYLSQLDYIRPSSDSTSGSPVSISDSLDSIVGGIAEEITLMHQLSNTIRKASREGQNVRAATSFRILDEDGNDMGQWFLDFFALGIIQRRFPGCNEALQKRLAVGMLIRRKRILYRRSRYWKSSSKIPSAPVKAISRPSKEDVTNQEQTPVPPRPEPALTQRERSVACSQAVTATTLNLEHWKKASTPSVVSRAKTIHWSSHEQLDFPPPPLGPIRRRLKALRERYVAEHEERLKLLSKPLCQNITIYGQCPYEDKGCAFKHDPNPTPFHGSSPTSMQSDSKSFLEDDLERKIENDRIACNNGSMEVVCPYCCCSLSSSIVTNKLKWIDHVKYDLDPYVCLFDECDSPNELYNHSEDWLNHMRQHSLRWRCTAKSHGVLVFHTRGDYEDHMSSKHKSTKSQLKILAERSSRSSGSLFESCPLCGESTCHRLEEHVASHLRYLALKSLPFPDDDEYDDCSEDLASEFQSAGGRTRSTMLEDDDLSGSPSETGGRNEVVIHGSPAYSPHPSHEPLAYLPPERASQQSHLPPIPTTPEQSGHSVNGMADLDTVDPAAVRRVHGPTESDNLLSKAESSNPPARPHDPLLPNSAFDPELVGSLTAVPDSSEWDFINNAHATHFDPSLDPILATFQAEMPAHATEPKPPSGSSLDGPILGEERPDEGPVASAADSLYPRFEESFTDVEIDMLSSELERPEKCPIVNCNYITESFAREHDRRMHLLTHHRRAMICYFCPHSVSDASRSFTAVDDFKRHLASQHGADQELPDLRQRPDCKTLCSNCSKYFVTAQEFYKHLEECTIHAVLREGQKATTSTCQASTDQESPEVNTGDQQQRVRSHHLQNAQTKVPESPVNSDHRYNLMYQQHLLRLRQDMATRLMEQYGPPTQYPPDVAREYRVGLENAAEDFVQRMIQQDRTEVASSHPSVAGINLGENTLHLMQAERSPPYPDVGCSHAPISDEQQLPSAVDALGKADHEHIIPAWSIPRRVHFKEVSHSNSDNDPNSVRAAHTQRQSDRCVLCHACGRVWRSGLLPRLDCPYCYSDFTEIIITPQEEELSDTIVVEDFNALADHAQSMSIGTAAVDPEPAPEATGVHNRNKVPTTTDNDLFTRAVSKYRDAFLEQHSHLAEDERLRLWTQQLPQFIDGTSNVPNLIPRTPSGKKRRGSGVNPPAERIRTEDTLGFQSGPVSYRINTDETEPIRTMSRIAREAYVTNPDAESVDSANTVATPGCAHRDEILKR
ncbi:hypothetical protein BDV11DRAFT_172208 [Aspergillus similis]